MAQWCIEPNTCTLVSQTRPSDGKKVHRFCTFDAVLVTLKLFSLHGLT
jgi:hypothetical protein